MDGFDLGAYARQVTGSSEAQRWFNQGLNWCFGFNHEAAIVCFEKAIEADAGCGMAHWGIAYAIGPNYNKLWEFFGPEEKVTALERAHGALKAGAALSDRLAPVENAMIAALAAKFPTDRPFARS